MEILSWDRKKGEMEPGFRNASNGVGTCTRGLIVGDPLGRIYKLQNLKCKKALDIWGERERENKALQ